MLAMTYGEIATIACIQDIQTIKTFMVIAMGADSRCCWRLLKKGNKHNLMQLQKPHGEGGQDWNCLLAGLTKARI